MATLILPSAVLTHLKAGVRAALGPDPVLMAWCEHPACVTVSELFRPSLTTEQLGSRLPLANPEMDFPQKLATRRSFSRTGFPSGVVSTATTNGVLPGAPRPLLPPERSPPRPMPAGRWQSSMAGFATAPETPATFPRLRNAEIDFAPSSKRNIPKFNACSMARQMLGPTTRRT